MGNSINPIIISSIVFLVVISSFLQTYYCEDSESFMAKDAIAFGQKVQESNKEGIVNATSKRLSYRSTPNGRKFGVYDGLLSAVNVLLTRRFLTFDNEAWLFNNYDAVESKDDKNVDNVPWTNDQDPMTFSNSELCRRLQAAVADVSGERDVTFYPYRVFGKIIRRGDHTKVSTDSEESGEYSALVFVNEYWRKNYYGEMYLYDANREIVGGATPRVGRVVVWESTIPFLNRPPAVTFLQGQILFHVKFSKNKQKMEEGHKYFMKRIQERANAYSSWHLPDYMLSNGEQFIAPNPADHLKFKYTSKSGRKLFVFDDVFPKDVLDHLRSFVLNYGTYYYDDSIDEGSDNVQWIAGFPLDEYLQSPYWKVVKKIATYASEIEELFPYDISINLVRSADHTKIHNDTSYPDETEFTLLVYLNPDWEQNNYGETTFFENDSDDTEILAQVRPRYGRTVIFDGNIPHSARPPSFNFSGARLTFVTKLSKNEFIGRRKYLSENLRHLRANVENVQRFGGMKDRKKAEILAQRHIKRVQEMSEKRAYHPDSEMEGDEEEDEEEEEERDQNVDNSEPEDDEEERDGVRNKNVNDQSDYIPGDPSEHEWYEEDEDESPITRGIREAVRDTRPDQPDAIDRLTRIVTSMEAKSKKVMELARQRIIDVL